MKAPEEVTLMQTAATLRLDYHAALRLVLRGLLEGAQNERGRWMVRADSVRRYQAAAEQRPAPTFASRPAVAGAAR
jgi:hypothetical protein